MEAHTFVLVALLPHCALAYSYGAPVHRHPNVCIRMSPGRRHGNNTATGPPPYTIAVSEMAYTPGKSFQVTIRADQGVTFSGFFIQARSQADTSLTSALGTFMDIPHETHVLNCSSTAGAWSHSNDKDRTEVTATWMPPSESQDTIAFQATIVRGPKSVYWEGVKSLPLCYMPSAAPGPVFSGVFPLTFANLLALMVGLP
ncbi:putative defense protein isoform X2 [Acanthaster planci]|uniref:Defense protein isoform X2 n=1 Tax=Acanthaster planci TaxID=133434 RepID=A0A8B7YWT7_ACAPL|nr:putative defense protein isoform X2 [Acanthaster planci]XP_022097157.1 putative defense protein isoform X2 [Acanthaster planci]